jgi:ribosomal protein S27AE
VSYFYKKKEECPDCDAICLEIKTHGYPKEIHEPNIKKVFHEYRYVCPNCGSEWLHDTLLKLYLPIPEDAQFHFDKNGKVKT